MTQYKLHNPYGNVKDPKSAVYAILEDHGLANIRQVLGELPFPREYYRDDADSTVTVGEIHLPYFEYIDVNLHTIQMATDGSHILVTSVDTTTCDSCERETDRDALDVTEEGNALCPSCSLVSH